MNYVDAIDPDFGQYTINDNIIVAPFWKREFCDYLVEEAKHRKNEFQTIEDMQGTGDLVYHLNFVSFNRPLYEQVQSHFLVEVRRMLAKEWYLPPNEIPKIYSPYILWYELGKFFRYWKHVDRTLISCNIKLNDNYEGCNIHFPLQKFSNEIVPIGHAVFWPGSLTHPHYVDDLKSGEKFSTCILIPPPRRSETETVWGHRQAAS